MPDSIAAPASPDLAAVSLGLHPSTIAAVRELRERFPKTPFLTLGQTPLWDEPVKAAFCAITEAMEQAELIAPGARIVAGVHDTDYFAKLEGLAIRDAPFAVLRHSDGDTRGLWSAAGEISAFFGAEIVPNRADFAREGVSLAKAARAYPGGLETLLNQETDAPLWRAIVHTEPRPLIAAEVRLRDIEPALREQLKWSFRHSLRALGCPEDFETSIDCPAGAIARQIWGWNDEFLAGNPDATLSDLYRDLIPKTWGLVGGQGACHLETTASIDLFRFNAQTASAPRFGFVDLFLNPATRELAKRTYNDAVRGSGIYTLDGFGEGALPFDVVIKGKGRGTLRLFEGKVIVETEPPVEICENCDPDSVERLAALLEGHFGSEICLVGKAVALISMLAAEYIFVFHEKASSYTVRTQKMNADLRAAGLELPLHPMLRLKYATWDALEGVEADFRLPPHLETAFGASEISAREFAARWKEIGAGCDTRRRDLKSCARPRDLMAHLSDLGQSSWRGKSVEYGAAGAVLTNAREESRGIGAQILALRAAAKRKTAAALELETRKGADFRAEIAPLQERLATLREGAAQRLSPADDGGKPRRLSQEERAAQRELDAVEAREISEIFAQIESKRAPRALIGAQIAALRAEARESKKQARGHVARRVELEKSAPAKAARALRRKLENEAELQRFLLVRDAIRASETLRQTNYRPTAWWLPMASPDGAWFRGMVRSAQATLEAL